MKLNILKYLMVQTFSYLNAIFDKLSSNFSENKSSYLTGSMDT